MPDYYPIDWSGIPGFLLCFPQPFQIPVRTELYLAV
jgi:hypothetical protein